MTQETKQKSVREYLDALVWDGKPRIDRWLVNYAGAADSAYTHKVSRRVLIGAVRRARQPGCRLDELLVLVAPQGVGTSTALRILAVDTDWFTQGLPLDDASLKCLVESTAGKWIVEADELTGLAETDIESLKACLARQSDVAPRMPYQRQGTSRLRDFIIIGTTNAPTYANFFLNENILDETTHRRFWPLQIKSFDLDRLRIDRDQIWAEAAAAEAAGETVRFADESSREHLKSIAPIKPQNTELLLELIAELRARIAGPTTGNRLRELATRLVAVGPKACAVSASECHEISDGMHTLLDEFELLRSGVARCLQNTKDTQPIEAAVVLAGLQKSLDFLLERCRDLEEKL